MVAATEDTVVYYEETPNYDYQLGANGMAMDPTVLGYGSVEVLESNTDNNFIDTISSLWRSFTGNDSGNDDGGGNVQVGMSN